MAPPVTGEEARVLGVQYARCGRALTPKIRRLR